MSIEIISIGNEILSGSIVNTNAAFISRQLGLAGLNVSRHTVLPDDGAIIKEGLQGAMQRSAVIITTGGLGPTCDDMTRQFVAELFECPLVFNQPWADLLKKKFGGNLSTIQDQATIPEKAEVLPNPLGTAPGLLFRREKGALVMLPGVPSEMKGIFLNEVVPLLQRNDWGLEKKESVWINLLGMREAEIDPLLREIEAAYPGVQAGIYPQLSLVHISFTAAQGRSSDLEKAANKIKAAFPDKVFEAESGKLEEAVHTYFTTHGLTLAAAESCTGGALAARLTSLAGASAYFLGSLVVYSNDLKVEFLGVHKETLERYGAVSVEVVKEMLEGIQKRTGCDYALAVSGIAGPTGGTAEKPVGTVCAGIAKKGEAPDIWRMRAPGNRETIITYSVNAILGRLLKHCSEMK